MADKKKKKVNAFSRVMEQTVKELPTIDVDGEIYYIQKFKLNQNQLVSAMTIYDRLADISGFEGSESPTRAMAIHSVMAGMFVMDKKGRRVFISDDDFIVWIGYIGKFPDMLDEIMQKSGYTEWLDEVKKSSSAKIEIGEVEPKKLPSKKEQGKN